MLQWRPWFLDFILASSCLLLLLMLFRWTRDLRGRDQRACRIAIAAAFVIVAITAALSIHRIASYFPSAFVVFLRAVGITTSLLTVYATAIAIVARRVRVTDVTRRYSLHAVAALPVVVGAAAYIERSELRIIESDLPIAGLPRDLQGLRIVQLSDIHLSALVSERFLARAVDMANEARASLAIVTGDLISWFGDPLDVCLKQLARLRSDAGNYGCMGNHEIYAGAEAYTARAGRRLGIRFLRQEAQSLRFGDAKLNLVGVDYQRREAQYLVGVESLRDPGATNLLMSHNPDVFPVAANKGFDATLAGHTHGGQVNFELIHPALNIARFYTPYVSGLYRIEGKSLYVTRGIGTIGVPARLGAPPEVTVLRLCAT